MNVFKHEACILRNLSTKVCKGRSSIPGSPTLLVGIYKERRSLDFTYYSMLLVVLRV